MSESLARFLILARQPTATGRVLNDIITRALHDPSILSFSELLEVAELKLSVGPEFQPVLKLLRLFSRETYDHYKGSPFFFHLANLLACRL